MLGFRKKEDTRDIFEKLYNDADEGADTILNYYLDPDTSATISIVCWPLKT